MTDAHPVARARLALAQLAALEQADARIDDAVWSGRLTAVLVHLLEYVDGSGAGLAGKRVLDAGALEVVRQALADAQAWREPALGRCCDERGMCDDHLTDQQLAAAYQRLAEELG